MTSALRALALAALAAGASVARAAPSVLAEPAFSRAGMNDVPCFAVSIANDSEARRVTLRGREADPESRRAEGPMTVVELDLAPGARKRVFVSIALPRQGRAVVELLQDGRPVATTLADVAFADWNQPLVGVVGDVPRSLPAAVGGGWASSVPSEAELAILGFTQAAPALLPQSAHAWPEMGALAWDGPRSADLVGVATAIREHVESGGRLIVGPHPEEPDAFAAAGLAELLPATPVLGAMRDWTLSEADPSSVPVGREGALARRRGLGTVILVPRALDDVAKDEWRDLIGLKAEPRQSSVAGWRLAGSVPVEDLSPEPPTRAAGLLLAAFLVAAVPVDGLLTRRSLRRGRRSRFGALRFPAIVVAATAAAFLVAEAASRGDRRLLRVDVVDVGPDGRGAGRMAAHFAQGRTGRVDLELAGGALTGAGFTNRGMPMTEGVELERHGSADPAIPVRSASMRAGAWAPAEVLARWPVPARPRVEGSGDLLRPQAAGWTLAGRSLGDGSPNPRWIVHGDGSVPESHHALLRSVDWSVTDFAYVVASREGPELTIDGQSTDEGESVTLVRMELPDATAAAPSSKGTP